MDGAQKPPYMLDQIDPAALVRVCGGGDAARMGDSVMQWTEMDSNPALAAVKKTMMCVNDATKVMDDNIHANTSLFKGTGPLRKALVAGHKPLVDSLDDCVKRARAAGLK